MNGAARLGPMAAAAGRLGDDNAAADRMIEAVHEGDSARVQQLFADVGDRGVTRTVVSPVSG